MNIKEIELVIRYLSNSNDSIMLEWGSGGSTSLFSKYVKKYYSIEHNLDWYYEVRKYLVNNNITNVVQFLNDYPKGRSEVYKAFYEKWEDLILQVSTEPFNNYYDIKKYPNPKEMYIWYQYVNAIGNFEVKIYDYIFIDGRSRVNCAFKALNYINENSIVFIHDFFNRPEYNVIFNYYYEIDSIKDTEQTIVVLKKK